MAIINFWKNIFNFKDKTKPGDFWAGYLVNWIIILLIYCSIRINNDLIFYIFSFYAILFLIAVVSSQVRRLHDRGKSAWYLLWNIIPVLNIIYLVELIRGSIESEEYSDRNYV